MKRALFHPYVSVSWILSTITLLVALPSETRATPVTDVDYKKTFFLNGVAAGAGINAGAVAQTWRTGPDGAAYIQDSHKITDDLFVGYSHGIDITDRKVLDGTLPFPVSPTGKTVDPPGLVPPPVPLVAYRGSTGLATDGPPHNLPNKAQADVEVVQRIIGNGPVVNIRLGGGGGTTGPVTLMDSVQTTLSGFASAGKPTDPDADSVHSADSFAAVAIAAAKIFRQVAPGAHPMVEAIGRTAAVAGVVSGAGKTGNFKDPYFLTVADLTTGASITEVVMKQTIDAFDASYSVDDSGIRLTIDRNDPASFISLAFSNAISSWVLNPYTYGATLDNTGFSAYGETPSSAWFITKTSDTIEAFFAFGPDGEPFDSAQVLPPDSLFTVGDLYTYDAGSDNGAFELFATPEPSTLLLLTSALIGMGYIVRRRFCRVTRPLGALA